MVNDCSSHVQDQLTLIVHVHVLAPGGASVSANTLMTVKSVKAHLPHVTTWYESVNCKFVSKFIVHVHAVTEDFV